MIIPQGKSTVINKFFEREENSRPTLALEYSYGRRTASSLTGGGGGTPTAAQKQLLNVWELGSLENATQLIEVPARTHGLKDFAAIIMLDLSEPQRVWTDLECAYQGLHQTCLKLMNSEEMQLGRERTAERLKKQQDEPIIEELMPFPVIIVGAKYDIFKDFGSSAVCSTK